MIAIEIEIELKIDIHAAELQVEKVDGWIVIDFQVESWMQVEKQLQTNWKYQAIKFPYPTD